MNTEIQKFVYIIEHECGKEIEAEITVNLGELMDDTGMTRSEAEKAIDDAIQKAVKWTHDTGDVSTHTVKL